MIAETDEAAPAVAERGGGGPGLEKEEKEKEEEEEEEEAVLVYFRGRGLAEPVRWVLSAAGIAFRDRPLETHAEFEALCEVGDLPWRQIPLLLWRGEKYVQVFAIVRHIARLHDLYGDPTSPDDAVHIDEIAEATNDLAAELAVSWRNRALQDEEEKVAAEARTVGIVQRYMCRFAERIATRGQGRYVATRDRPSYADVLVAEMVDWSLEIYPEAMQAEHREMIEYHARIVAEFPRLKAFLASDQRYPVDGEAFRAAVRVVLNRK